MLAFFFAVGGVLAGLLVHAFWGVPEGGIGYPNSAIAKSEVIAGSLVEEASLSGERFEPLGAISPDVDAAKAIVNGLLATGALDEASGFIHEQHSDSAKFLILSAVLDEFADSTLQPNKNVLLKLESEVPSSDHLNARDLWLKFAQLHREANRLEESKNAYLQAKKHALHIEIE